MKTDKIEKVRSDVLKRPIGLYSVSDSVRGRVWNEMRLVM